MHRQILTIPPFADGCSVELLAVYIKIPFNSISIPIYALILSIPI